jgi:transcriptional regulator with XRE-family HTH domain
VKRSRSPIVDTIDLVLLDLLRTAKWTQRQLAERLGLSTKTIGRYVCGQAVPPVSRRHAIVAALRDVDPPQLARIAASLGLSKDVLPPPPAADPAVAASVVDAASHEVAERLDAGPIRVRAALARFVAQLAEANVDPRTAQALLTRR